MRLVYLTSKTYPASTADHIYVLELAKGFHAILKDQFSLIVAYAKGTDLKGLPVKEARPPFGRLRTVWYFFWLPYYLATCPEPTVKIVFFSNDRNLLLILLFWKKVLRMRYAVCSDWHMLFGGWRDRLVMQGSDFLVTTSEKLKKAILQTSVVDTKKVLVAYGGIDLTTYSEMRRDEACRHLSLPQDKTFISYIGFFKTMGMEKGIRTMIEALPQLSEEVQMLFVGGKDDEIAEYTAYAQELQVANRCVFVGRKSQDELAVYEAASTILAIPYPDQPHFRNAGFPMKVYEYMASGRPIIYSRLELVEEVIAPYACGFTPDDATDFARAARLVLGDPVAWQEKAAQAVRAVQTYSWEEKARKILSFTQV